MVSSFHFIHLPMYLLLAQAHEKICHWLLFKMSNICLVRLITVGKNFKNCFKFHDKIFSSLPGCLINPWHSSFAPQLLVPHRSTKAGNLGFRKMHKFITRHLFIIHTHAYKNVIGLPLHATNVTFSFISTYMFYV